MKINKAGLIYEEDGTLALVDNNFITLGVWGTLIHFWKNHSYRTQFPRFFNWKTIWLFLKGFFFALVMSAIRILAFPFCPLMASMAAVSNAKARRRQTLMMKAQYECFRHGLSSGNTDAYFPW